MNLKGKSSRDFGRHSKNRKNGSRKTKSIKLLGERNWISEKDVTDESFDEEDRRIIELEEKLGFKNRKDKFQKEIYRDGLDCKFEYKPYKTA
jgi:predicted phosphohydrolase